MIAHLPIPFVFGVFTRGDIGLSVIFRQHLRYSRKLEPVRYRPARDRLMETPGRAM